MKIDKSIFHRYIPRVTDRRNSLRAFVLTVVLGVVALFVIGFIFVDFSAAADVVESAAEPIEYRGGYPEVHHVANLYVAGKYLDAIDLADSLLSETDRDSIPELHRRVLDGRNAARDYELIWVKINALVAMGHEQDALVILNSYVKIKGVYQQPALALKSEINPRIS